MPVAGKTIHVSFFKREKAIMVRPRSKTDRPKGREKELCDNIKLNFQSASVGTKTRSAGTDPFIGSFFLPGAVKKLYFSVLNHS